MNSLSDNDIDKLASSYGKNFEPDVEAALRKVRGRIHDSTPGAKVRSLFPRRWLSAAAAVLLLMSAAYFLLPSSPTTVYANAGEIPLSVSLPDGTRATLQQGAEIRLLEAFNETERRIELNGQAFFRVHKDKERPFLVADAETELRVTGTAFNLRVEGGEMEVEVSEGSVELNRDFESIAVGAKQCGLAKTGASLALMDAPNLNRHAWRTGKMYFQDAPLSVVLEALRTNFGYEVSVEGRCEFPVSGGFTTEEPTAILRTIAKLGGGRLEASPGAPNHFRMRGVCQ